MMILRTYCDLWRRLLELVSKPSDIECYKQYLLNKWVPEERKTAKELLNDPWLNSA